MNPVHLIGVELTLTADKPISDDELTDLVEAVIDDLDHLPGVDPSVGTTRTGDLVVMEVEVFVFDEDEWEAFDHGVAIIRASIHAAGIGTAGWVRPSNLQAGFRQLENA